MNGRSVHCVSGRANQKPIECVSRIAIRQDFARTSRALPIDIRSETYVAPSQTNLLQGTLDLLILKALALGELHGLGVSQRIEQSTRGTCSVGPGSLFPDLHRLESNGWLSAEWGASENNRKAKYYKLT